MFKLLFWSLLQRFLEPVISHSSPSNSWSWHTSIFFANTQVVLWDPLYSCSPNVNTFTRVWFHHYIHSTACGSVFKLFMKNKYLCETLRVCWKHDCLGVPVYLFGSIFSISLKVMASCDQWRREWQICFTKMVTHSTASRNLVMWSVVIFISNVPLCIFCVLCSTYFYQI